MSRMEAIAKAAEAAGNPIRQRFVIPEGDKSSVPGAYEPATVYSSITEVSRALRKDPDTPLLRYREPLPPDVAVGFKDPASQTLLKMLNSSGEGPEAGLHRYAREARAAGILALGACVRVEEGFGMAFAQMAQPDETLPGQDKPIGYELITGRDGEVVAVGKGFGEPSALALRDIDVDGIHVPAGMVLRADTTATRRRMGPYQPTIGEGLTYSSQKVVPFSSIKDLAPIRLTGYAIDPASRRQEFPQSFDYSNRANREIMHDASLVDLRWLSDRALATAQIEPLETHYDS
jgi:hypothetical protein